MNLVRKFADESREDTDAEVKFCFVRPQLETRSHSAL